jgi:hypothetical protein
MQPFIDTTDLLADAAGLRNQFERDGYVYMRGLLDAENLRELRREIVSICADCGWLKSGSDPMEAIAWTSAKVEGEDEYFEVYDRVQSLESLHALAHDESLMGLMRALLGDDAFPHPLSIARLVFPEVPQWSTPPHQDFINNQGTPRLYASWVPLSDCPQELGALAVLPGSHQWGLLPVEYSLGAGHRQAVLPQQVQPETWVGGDLELGDVLVFHSLTVHKALPNTTPAMRLSVDFRYQREAEVMTERCLKPHFERMSWEDIYRGWKRDELKYYWRDKTLSFAPWDDQLGMLPDTHMKEAVRAQRAFDKQRQLLAEKYAAGGPNSEV